MRSIRIAAACLVTLPGAATLAARADVPTPIQSALPIALDRLRVNNPAVFSLTGSWRFQLTRGEMRRDGYHSGSMGPVTASSAQEGHAPADVLKEGDSEARWCASGADMPQWWQADLGTAQDVASVDIRWEFDSAAYRYRLESSPDGKNWHTVVSRTTSSASAPAFSPFHSRFVRITIADASRPNGTTWASIRHVAIGIRSNGAVHNWTPPVPKPESAATRDTFASPATSDSSWAKIQVPWNWEMAGFSKPTYDNPDNAVGLYRRTVTVPAAFAGKTVIWHFEGVWDSAELFINGVRAGYHESGFTAFDMDVTRYVKAGLPNLLAIRVCKTTPSDDLDTGDYWSLGGIYRDTYMVAVAPTHVESIKIETPLNNNYRDAHLKVALALHNSASGQISVHGELFHADGKRVANVALEGTASGSGSVDLTITGEARGVKLWSAEKPNLYYLVLSLTQGGKLVERVQERFGFRQIEIKGGVVLWNGVPIKCTGSCRHEEFALLGHALNEAAWTTDLTLMKGCNINAIRTSHYNHAGRFLELCDEVGIYVLDEVPACWCNLSDPKLRDAFVQRTKETLDRDQNKPCVLAWSLANESGYGPNAAAMLDYVKAKDPTHPAFVSQCGPWNNPKIDFVDTHYPSIEEVHRLATDKLRATTPVVMTEQPHIFYVGDGLAYDYGEKDLWGQALAANWSVVWPTDSILGSFIWEWQDQGIADLYPGNDGRDASGLRGNNVKGIVDGYRNPKPEYWNIKMVYSPVTSSTREVPIVDGVISVPLQNRYSFTDLSELNCEWQELAGDHVITTGIKHISCAPRSSTIATFTPSYGMDTLRLEFFHPDGRSVYSTRIHLQGAQALPAAPDAADQPLAVTLDTNDDTTSALVGSAGSGLTIDNHTGTIRSWKSGAFTMLKGGPTLNLGEHRANHGDHGASNFIESKESPRLGSVAVSSSMEGPNAVIIVKGLVTLAEQRDPVGRLTTIYTVLPNGDVAVKWALAWAATSANLWELGLKLPVSGNLTSMAWAREGFWTDYPKDHIGAIRGTAAPSDLTFRSSKRDVRWVTLTNPNGAGLCALPLENALHTRGLHEAPGNTLFLSAAIAPPYDFSTNLLPEKLIHLTQGETVGGDFLLRPVVPTKK